MMNRIRHKSNKNEFEIAINSLIKSWYKIFHEDGCIDEMYVSNVDYYKSILDIPNNKFIRIVIDLDVPSEDNPGFSFPRTDELNVKGEIFHSWQIKKSAGGLDLKEECKKYNFIPYGLCDAINSKVVHPSVVKSIYHLFSKIPQKYNIIYIKNIEP